MDVLRQVFRAILLVALALFSMEGAKAQQTVSKEQQQRMDLMKSRGVDASLTILPVGIPGIPGNQVAIVIGVLLEEQGLKNIEVGNTEYKPAEKASLKVLADSVGKFVKTHPITTEYALFTEMNADIQRHVFTELIGIVVDKTGAVVWMEKLDSADAAFRDVGDPDPMGYSMLLAQRLEPNLGLSSETFRAAKPGKMAELFRETFGMPTDKVTAQLIPRQEIMRENFKRSTLMVFPVRIMNEASVQEAGNVVKMINDAGLCQAASSKDSLLLNSWVGPNEMKMLWDLAAKFSEYIKKNPPKADYVLYANYAYSPNNWREGFVHTVICDRAGEWVVVDMQNSVQDDYQKIRPISAEDCSKLLFTRLQHYLKASVANVIRETMEKSGMEAANAKFKELQADSAHYYISEQEMNMLGYDFIWAKKYQESIAVFKMNVEAFPESFNTYDSLGEAYAASGETDLAIKNYEKSVQLNPNSQSGKDALKKLKPKQE